MVSRDTVPLSGESLAEGLLRMKTYWEALNVHFANVHFCLDAAFLLTIGSFLLTVKLSYLQLTISAFLLTVGACLLTVLAVYLQLELFCLQWESASNRGLKGL